jgi:hypothetical protein
MFLDKEFHILYGAMEPFLACRNAMQTPHEATTKMKSFATVIPVTDIGVPEVCSMPSWTKNCSCEEVKHDNIKIELNTEKETQASIIYMRLYGSIYVKSKVFECLYIHAQRSIRAKCPDDTNVTSLYM